MLKPRLEKIRRLLLDRGQRLSAGWLGDGRLERTFLLAASMPRLGPPQVFRMAGTLRPNNLGQSQIYYGPELVRVKDGPRKGLAVPPDRLKPEEGFVPAGMSRSLTEDYAQGFGRCDKHNLELLDNVEELLGRPTVCADKFPEPRAVKRAPDPKAFKPRFTGAAYKIVYSTPGYEEEVSMLDNFNRLVESIAIKAPDGVWELSFELAAVGGVTVMNTSSDRCWALPKGGLDTKSDLFEIRVEKQMSRRSIDDGRKALEGSPAGPEPVQERVGAGVVDGGLLA